MPASDESECLGHTAFHPGSGRPHRVLGMDAAPDVASHGPAAFPHQPELETAFLRKPDHHLAAPAAGERRKNPLSLYKRGGVWWSYLWQDGIRHAQSTKTGNRKQAERIEAKLKADLVNRRFNLVDFDPTITFGEIAARFLAGGSARPHHGYHLKFLLPFFEDTPVLRISKALAEDFRKARRKTNPNIKDGTVNRDLSVLRRILYWAVDEQLILNNPIARLRMPPERRIRRQVLSLIEEEKLLGAAKGHISAMVLMALDTGMRRGEITSERWEDVDFAQNILAVTHSKTPDGEKREIPLTNRLRAYLSANRKPDGLVIAWQGQPVKIV